MDVVNLRAAVEQVNCEIGAKWRSSSRAERKRFAISFWQSKENAEAYSRTGYPEELKALGKVARELISFRLMRSPTRRFTRSPLVRR